MKKRVRLGYVRPALVILLLLSGLEASASPIGGTRYEVVGFSLDGLVLAREYDLHYGVRRLVVRDTRSEQSVATRTVDAGESPDEVEAELKRAHRIVGLGYAGVVSPARTAMILVVPGPLRGSGAFDYTVRRISGAGDEAVATISVGNACRPDTPRAAQRLEVRWTPDGSAAVLAGSVRVDAPCGEPQMVPVLSIFQAGPPLSRTGLEVTCAALGSRAEGLLASERRGEALAVLHQVVSARPDDHRALLELARIRLTVGDERGAVAALWAVYRHPAGRPGLKSALEAAWVHGLSRRHAVIGLRALLGSQVRERRASEVAARRTRSGTQ